MEHYPTWPNLPAMMFGLARTWPDKPLLRRFRDGGWHSTTWGEFGRMAASCARHLRAAGVTAGDRVVIVSENRPEYPIAETALMALRAVPVPTYTSNTVADHAHILRDSGARAAIVSSPALAGALREAGRLAGGLDLLVVIDGPPDASPRALDLGDAGGSPRLMHWGALAADDAPADDIALEAASIPADALACLIYTSGTGGAPKGVMLPHRSILSNCRGAFELLRPLRLQDEVYLSYLPASHSYEHTVGLYFLPSIGTEIAYCRGVEHLAADLLTIRPTILTAVPRVLEVIRSRVLTQVARQARWQQALFNRALELGMKRADGRRMNVLEGVIDPLLDRLVRAKVQARFGGRLKAAMSGGARLEPEVGRFFLALGLMIMQGYGQTEAGPVISANPPDGIRIDTVGRVLQGVDVRLAEDDEILVRGDLVMQGYWGLPDATAAVIRDGWLHTGDIGALDDDGYLRITDRKKDMIVLSGGENVSPAKVEGMLMTEPEISQAVVAGDGRSSLTALVVPTQGYDDVAAALAITRVNHRLSVTERIRKHAVVEAFTVENGLLTPTQKIRRVLVIRANTNVLAKLHG
ncbi:MAG TPA: long-chain fatty acid--CoA ligase [Acetobacteraceae bacterium]